MHNILAPAGRACFAGYQVKMSALFPVNGLMDGAGGAAAPALMAEDRRALRVHGSPRNKCGIAFARPAAAAANRERD